MEAPIINDPETLASLTAACEAYETALVANHVERLDGYFWRSARTVRFGLAECLYGFEDIAAFRRARSVAGLARDRKRVVVNTFGTNFGTYSAEDARSDGRVTGRISQSWVRLGHDWQIVAAHVSTIDATPARPDRPTGTAAA